MEPLKYHCNQKLLFRIQCYTIVFLVSFLTELTRLIVMSSKGNCNVNKGDTRICLVFMNAAWIFGTIFSSAFLSYTRRNASHDVILLFFLALQCMVILTHEMKHQYCQVYMLCLIHGFSSNASSLSKHLVESKKPLSLSPAEKRKEPIWPRAVGIVILTVLGFLLGCLPFVRALASKASLLVPNHTLIIVSYIVLVITLFLLAFVRMQRMKINGLRNALRSNSQGHEKLISLRLEPPLFRNTVCEVERCRYKRPKPVMIISIAINFVVRGTMGVLETTVKPLFFEHVIYEPIASCVIVAMIGAMMVLFSFMFEFFETVHGKSVMMQKLGMSIVFLASSVLSIATNDNSLWTTELAVFLAFLWSVEDRITDSCTLGSLIMASLSNDLGRWVTIYNCSGAVAPLILSVIGCWISSYNESYVFLLTGILSIFALSLIGMLGKRITNH